MVLNNRMYSRTHYNIIHQHRQDWILNKNQLFHLVCLEFCDPGLAVGMVVPEEILMLEGVERGDGLTKQVEDN